MSFDMTTALSLLKECYSKERVENLTYAKRPLLALLSKKQDVGGKYFDFPVVYGNGARRSATVGTSQTLAQGSSLKSVDFNVPLTKNYSSFSIDGLAMASTKGDMNAFLDAVTAEIDASYSELANDIARSLYQSGFGTKGVIAAISGDTITFAVPSDANNFEQDQQIVFAANESSSALRDSGAALTVSRVDRNAGTVTFSANVSTVSGVVPGDYCFEKGDRENAVAPDSMKIAGLASWIPSTAPSSSDSFYNVNRSVDTVRLAGNRYTPAEGLTLDQILMKAASIVDEQEGTLSHFMMHPSRWNELQNILGSKVQYTQFKVGTVGFGALEIQGPGGSIDCVSDRHCPADKIYGINVETLQLISAGDWAMLDDIAGGKFERVQGSDKYEGLHKSYSNFIVKVPRDQIVINLTT